MQQGEGSGRLPSYLATMKCSGGRIRASRMKTWLRDMQKPHHGE